MPEQCQPERADRLEPGAGWASPPRLSVTISRWTHAALLDVRLWDGVSLTEAVRRLVVYGHAVYHAARAGREIVLCGGDRPPERLIVLDELRDDATGAPGGPVVDCGSQAAPADASQGGVPRPAHDLNEHTGAGHLA